MQSVISPMHRINENEEDQMGVALGVSFCRPRFPVLIMTFMAVVLLLFPFPIKCSGHKEFFASYFQPSILFEDDVAV